LVHLIERPVGYILESRQGYKACFTQYHD